MKKLLLGLSLFFSSTLSSQVSAGWETGIVTLYAATNYNTVIILTRNPTHFCRNSALLVSPGTVGQINAINWASITGIDIIFNAIGCSEGFTTVDAIGTFGTSPTPLNPN